MLEKGNKVELIPVYFPFSGAFFAIMFLGSSPFDIRLEMKTNVVVAHRKIGIYAEWFQVLHYLVRCQKYQMLSYVMINTYGLEFLVSFSSFHRQAMDEK